jgi:hypothetical protein
MSAPISGGVRFAVLAAVALGGAVAAPLACAFPTFTFDRPGEGGGGSSSQSSGQASTGGVTSTSGSTGGGGTTTSSTAMSSSSSSGLPCTTMDCSDPSCAADYACVPSTAPSGWTGPFSLYEGAPAADPGCPTEFPTSAYIGNNQIIAQQANCSTCTCANPQGQKCEVTGPADASKPNTIDPILVVDAACGTTPKCVGPLEVVPPWNGACYGPDGFASGQTTCGPGSNCTNGTQACNKAMQVAPLQVTGGTCTPSAQTPNVPAVSWSIAGEACGGAVAGTGCNAGKTCLPRPKAPFHTGVCIMQTGDIACPPGQFTAKHTFFTGSMDNRACSSCACDPAAGGTCSATVTVYSDSGCSAVIATLHPTTAAGDCANIANNPAAVSRKAVFTAPAGGMCPPTGGQPSGTATPTSPTTFCCIP